MRGQDLARLRIWKLTELDAFFFLFFTELHRVQIQLCLGMKDSVHSISGDQLEGMTLRGERSPFQV